MAIVAPISLYGNADGKGYANKPVGFAGGYVTVCQSGERYVWRIRQGYDCDRTSSETFDTEFEAALAAASVASAKRLPLKVSPIMRRLLVAHWYAQGWSKSAAHKSIDLCANQYERAGWRDYANEYWQAVYAEADSKPGLGGGYWPVAIELEAVA